MTTPTNLGSPFINNTVTNKTNDEKIEGVGEFSIHTMKDDLLYLQKNKGDIKNINQAEVSKIFIPKPTPMEAPQKKTFVPGEVSSKLVHPFVKQDGKLDTKDLDMAFSNNKKSASNRRKIAIIMSGVVATIVIMLGGYYAGKSYFLNKKSENAYVPIEIAEEETSQKPTGVTPATEPTVSMEKYSSTKPNYLSLDFTTISSEDIKKTLTSLAEELKTISQERASYEFVVVDANNKPVAFPIFATAAKLNLSPLILSSLGENFSLFLYNDSGNSRLSFAANVVKKEILIAELLKQEKSFITDASFLFLNEKPEIAKGLFKDSIYRDIPIRFFNVNDRITMSIDYSIISDKLIVSTSKNTMRAIVDRLIDKK
ncbi:MAG TPA: hypothetical protein P5548_01660 [Candidatus Moranbacteria bacterium]|nr:hypothetical protein [Candidatus Moranbacteria bacterium]HRZ33588.1 hypothetical protein [Candidatus Moranbacteria bacterium]